jgi:HAD superfamily hydrolase (TIGR01459 family)
LQHLTGFAPLADRYDGFILDLWGVIHDGVTLYPGAIDCLRRLRAAGKRSVLLSNAPRRAAVAQAAMRGMGIEDELYTAIVTSGEATHGALRDRPDAWWAALGRLVFHLGPERDRNVMAGLALECRDRPRDAEFVLNTGPDDEHDPTDAAAFDAVLRDCARHRLPMVCANPDLEVIRGGTRIICAGLLAQRYAALGGDVRSVGKPDPAIYGSVLELLKVSPDRVLAVGDSLRTDIAGAQAAGLAACWVLGGIHAERVGNPDAADTVAREAGLSPLACLPGLVW